MLRRKLRLKSAALVGHLRDLKILHLGCLRLGILLLRKLIREVKLLLSVWLVELMSMVALKL